MIKHYPSLRDSINKQFPVVTIPYLIFASILYPLFLSPAPLLSLMTLPLLFFANLPYPYYLASLLFRKKKKATTAKIPLSENEISYKTTDSFPLEKYTSGFTGEKDFSLSSEDSPHVVFLYLESFRSADVGSCTPYFDKLKKEGIYFSHFYAGASQTFKAMFATFYGLPPCFGPDFTESSSSTLSLPIRGLPDFFSDNGYNNVFIKAGSFYFENQGSFLQNHGFHELYDEKDIKAVNDKAYGTSWGVHDEFMYDFLCDKIKSSEKPLFISGASVTNHHPFILPKGYTPNHGTTPFTKTMEYSDYALGKAVEKLKALNTPMHVYIMGDHGYPDNHNERPGLSQTLDKDVTQVPLLILPLYCEPFAPTAIHSVSSQLDLLPTMMDIYRFTGLHSSIGSSLCRKRKSPVAYLLNEAIEPISGMVTKKSYETNPGYLPLYEYLADLYKNNKISSLKECLKILSFESISIPKNSLQDILDKNSELESLNLANSALIYSLDFRFPQTLKTLIIDNNILISDDDMKCLPKSLESISIKGCRNLTDSTLHYLSNLSIKEISFSCTNFSSTALQHFLEKSSLEKISMEDSSHIDNHFLLALKGHPLQEITINGSSGLSDEYVSAISSPFLKIFMCDNCINLSDASLAHLKNSSLEVLHLENGKNISDIGISYITPLKIHTFYVSKSTHITEAGANSLNTPFMQNLFCIDCISLPQVYEENPGKQIYFLKK